MSAEDPGNPYTGPTREESSQESRRGKRPGLITILIVTIGCVVAAVCGFFVSCFGLAFLADNGLPMDLGMLLWLSLLGAFIAFVVAWFAGMKIMR